MGNAVKKTMSLASPTGVAEVLTLSLHKTSIIYLNFYSLKGLEIFYFSNVDSPEVIFMKPKV